MKLKGLLCSSAFMMSLALVLSLITNLSGAFPGDVLTPNVRSSATILLLAAMMTVSLSRVPTRDLRPDRAIVRSVVLGLAVASAIPIAGYLLLRGGEYGDYAIGWVFIAATPFAASVAPLSFILRGDIEHACRSTIYVYIAALLWIPLVIWLLIGEMVDMRSVVVTVLEIIGAPLLLSRLLTGADIPKDLMAAALNCIIGLLVWLSVSPTDFGGLGPALFLTFGAIAVGRTFILGNAVELVEKRSGIRWGRRVTDILITSYKNKGIAIALCVSLLPGPLVGRAMVAITVSIVIEICWVIFMDSVLFSKRRMMRELASEEAVEPQGPLRDVRHPVAGARRRREPAPAAPGVAVHAPVAAGAVRPHVHAPGAEAAVPLRRRRHLVRDAQPAELRRVYAPPPLRGPRAADAAGRQADPALRSLGGQRAGQPLPLRLRRGLNPLGLQAPGYPGVDGQVAEDAAPDRAGHGVAELREPLPVVGGVDARGVQHRVVPPAHTVRPQDL